MPFDDSAELFAEGLEIVWRAWTEPGKWSHKGKFYEFNDVEVRPKPAQNPLRPYVACFSRPVDGAGGEERLERESMRRSRRPWSTGRWPMQCGSNRETCETGFKRPMRRAMCSYFVHIASTPEEERYGKEALVRYFQDALIAAFPSSSGEKVPPTYKYFVEIVNILRDMRPEKLTDKSILCGSPTAHRRYPEAGRGGRHRRGHPLLQLRPEAAPDGEGADAALHDRGGAPTSPEEEKGPGSSKVASRSQVADVCRPRVLKELSHGSHRHEGRAAAHHRRAAAGHTGQDP
jgi:hypothetical protein